MNITEFGVQELNQEEMKAIQGGWIGTLGRLIKRLLELGAIYDAVNEFTDGFKAGFKEGNC